MISDHHLERLLCELLASPLLDAQQEVDIARRAQDGDAEALDLLCRCNMRLAVAVARMYRQPGRGLSSEVLDEAMYGLVRTAHRYDVRYGVRFIHLGVWGIQFAIMDGMPELASGRKPTVRPVLHLIHADGTRPPRSIDPEYGAALTWIDRLAWQVASPVAETVDVTLRALDDTQAEVIRSFLGLCPEGPQTPAEIAVALGCTQADVLHLKDVALRSLRGLPSPPPLE